MAEYYDYIRVYGLAESQLECFQGLGAAALYNAEDSQPLSGGQELPETSTTTTPPGENLAVIECPAGLWQAQSEVITQQSSYLDDIRSTFISKRENLGVGFDIQEFTESSIFKWLADVAVKKIVDLVTDFIPGVADDVIVDTIATYAPKAIGWGLVWLHKQFLAGAALCERMQAENSQLLELKASIDMYRLRSDIISQHDLTIQSLLAQVAQVEAQIMKDVTSETSADKESEPAIVCPHTGDFIFLHSRGKMSKV